MPFEVSYNGGVIRGNRIADAENAAALVFLHGAGQASRDRFDGLRTTLYDTFGTPSLAFDYLNHGASSAHAGTDSLASRTEQAKVVIDQFKGRGRLSLVASSMSAYIALKLSEIYEVEALVLIVPAVYHRNAFAAPFETAFTEIIRRPSSWVNSDAWELLEAYTGKLLVVSAENDEVIPREIITYLYDMAYNARLRKRIEIPGASHQILRFLNTHPAQLKRLANHIHHLLES